MEDINISEEKAMENRMRIYAQDMFYHSTSSAVIDSILTEGLCTGKKNIWKLNEKEVIFISMSPEEIWAEYACDEFGGDPVFVEITGERLIYSGCKMYPDYRVPQPVDEKGDVIISEVREMMLLRCKCIPIYDWKKFEYKSE